jgi:ribosomal protein S27E
MPDKRTWEKWDRPEKPTGPGETGSAEPSAIDEVEGHSRQMTVTCTNCGAHQYVGAEAKWFVCWKCGATISDVMLT